MKQKMNLYEVYQQQKKRRKAINPNVVLVLFLLTIALCIGATGSYLTWMKSNLGKENKELNDYLSELTLGEDYAYVLNAQKDIDAFERLVQALNEVNRVFEAKQSFGSRQLKLIYQVKPASIAIDSIKVEGAVITLSARSKESSSFASFVASLKQVEEFLDASFPGYQLGSESSYSSVITVTLKGDY